MPHGQQDLRGLRARARQRGGVVSTEDLRSCGFSEGAVRRRVADGQWQRWGRAVILSSGGTLSDHGQAWAQQITYGPGAAVSGALAMRLAGWRLPSSAMIVVVPDKPRVGVPGVMVLRRDAETASKLRGGLRFVTAIDGLLDALITAPAPHGVDLLDAALQQRVVTPAGFRAAAERRLGRGHRGAGTLRALVQRALSGSRSEAEQRMRALLRRSTTGPWIPNYPILDQCGRVLAEIDFALEGLSIAIEVDGRAHHSDRRAFERDRARQNMLVTRGWLVLRFTWEQITQRPLEVLAAIHAAVDLRLAS